MLKPAFSQQERVTLNTLHLFVVGVILAAVVLALGFALVSQPRITGLDLSLGADASVLLPSGQPETSMSAVLTAGPPAFTDDRVCGDLPGAPSQSAAIFRGDNGLNFFEVSESGATTSLVAVSNEDVSSALTAAAAGGAPEVVFQAASYTVYALPEGLCQLNSTQYPVEGKTFTCTFTCN